MGKGRYVGVLSGALGLVALSGVAFGVYAMFDAWPSIEGAWEIEGDAGGTLYLYTRDGEMVQVSPGVGEHTIGTFKQDGSYVTITTYDVMTSKGDGSYGFTLKLVWQGQDRFTTDGPVGTYIFKRSPVTFRRVAPDSAAKRRVELNAGAGSGLQMPGRR